MRADEEPRHRHTHACPQAPVKKGGAGAGGGLGKTRPFGLLARSVALHSLHSLARSPLSPSVLPHPTRTRRRPASASRPPPPRPTQRAWPWPSTWSPRSSKRWRRWPPPKRAPKRAPPPPPGPPSRRRRHPRRCPSRPPGPAACAAACRPARPAWLTSRPRWRRRPKPKLAPPKRRSRPPPKRRRRPRRGPFARPALPRPTRTR